MVEGLDLHGAGPTALFHQPQHQSEARKAAISVEPWRFFGMRSLEEVMNQSRISAASGHKMGAYRLKSES